MEDKQMIDELPKKVFVGAYVFKIVPCTTGDKLLKSKGNAVNDGLTNTETYTIALDRGMTLKRLMEVVLHECIHCLNWVRDVEDGSTEEHFTTQLAISMTDFWLDNPRLIQWINRAARQIKKERREQ
jgi:hypothetical protein